MKKLFPRSLAGQTILVLVIGLTLSHAVSMFIFTGDRGEALSLMGGQHMAQRIANSAHLIGNSPVEWRDKILAGLNDHTFKVSLSRESALNSEVNIGSRAALIRRFVERQLRDDPVRRVLVQVLETAGPRGLLPQMRHHMFGMAYEGSPPVALRISIQLSDGQWLNFFSTAPQSNPFWSATSVFSLLSMVVAVILLSVWVVRRLTKPLGAFASAAQRLGKHINAPPMPVSGPIEVRRAIRAFNEMQARLQRFLENRTWMLAAISHDLRTPITRLRLRAELVEDDEERTKVLATLDEMEQMIASTLAFAREDSEIEQTRTVDISALVESVCNDFSDTGSPVEMAPSDSVLYDCRPGAMKRAITNLIDNAVKYGSSARIALEANGAGIKIIIEDDGPGIPAQQLDQVFVPFFRVDPSRNPKTGGTGLGLSVAQTIIHGHGGKIELENKPGRGLRVAINLPR